MKIRTDHVTNSSSSSFTITVKGELTKERILPHLKVPEDSPLYRLAKDIAELLARGKELNEDYDDWCWLDEEEKKEIKDLNKKGFSVHRGSINSDGEPIEWLLYETLTLHIKTDDIKIEVGWES